MIATLQAAIVAANANPQPTYTISGPTGSQSKLTGINTLSGA